MWFVKKRIEALLRVSKEPLSVSKMSAILGVPAAFLYPQVWSMADQGIVERLSDYSRASDRGGSPEYFYEIVEEEAE